MTDCHSVSATANSAPCCKLWPCCWCSSLEESNERIWYATLKANAFFFFAVAKSQRDNVTFCYGLQERTKMQSLTLLRKEAMLRGRRLDRRSNPSWEGWEEFTKIHITSSLSGGCCLNNNAKHGNLFSLGPDEGPEVRTVKEPGEANHWTDANACRVWCQNDEKGHWGTLNSLAMYIQHSC